MESYAEALELIPVCSDRHDRTRANLAAALNESDKLEDVQRAVNILRALPPRFRGTKYLTVERSMVAWTLGATLAKLDAASGVFSSDQIRLIWETLRALREATVAAGADPPVMVYAAP